MRWEFGAVCIMSPIKRDQSWRGAVELLQPSDDTQTPLHGMKRPAREVGRGFKHSEAPSREAEECFVWFCPRAANQELPVRPQWFAAHMWISPYSEILHLSWGLCLSFFFALPTGPLFPLSLSIR